MNEKYEFSNDLCVALKGEEIERRTLRKLLSHADFGWLLPRAVGAQEARQAWSAKAEDVREAPQAKAVV